MRKRVALQAPMRLTTVLMALMLIVSSLSIGAFAAVGGYRDDLNIAVVNFQSEWGDREANVEEMVKIVGDAAAAGVEMLLFPEMCVTGYRDDKLEDGSCMLVVEAEPIPGPTSAIFEALATEHDMYIIYGDTEVIAGDDEHAYNTAVVLGPDGYIGKYRKIHPVEGEWCLAGTEPMMFASPWGPIGVSICYDTYATPELERYYIANGARLILNPTASSRGYSVANTDSTNWEWYYRNRLESIADRDFVFVASANLVGPDGITGDDGTKAGLFPGGSVVLGPGNSADSYVQYYAGSTDDKVHGWSSATIDLSLATRFIFESPNWQPHLYANWYKELADDYAAQRPRPAVDEDNVVIGVVNFEAVWGDKEANIASMKTYIAEAAAAGVQLLVFPEMALTGYTDVEPTAGEQRMQVELAEAVPGPATEELLPLAEQHDMYIIFGLPEQVDGKVYNSAAVLMPDGTVGSYQKIHPIGDEPNWAERGDTPYMFESPWGPIGISICYDTYAMPELERYYAAKGCRIILNPTATSRGSTEGKWEWYYKNRLESIADRETIILASANLAGTDGPEGSQMTFPGGSVVVGTYLIMPNYHGTEIVAEPGLIVSDPVSVAEPGPDETRFVGFSIIGFNPSVFAKTYADLAAGVPATLLTASGAGESASTDDPDASTTDVPPSEIEEGGNNTMIYIVIAVVVVAAIFLVTRKKKAPVASEVKTEAAPAPEVTADPEPAPAPVTEAEADPETEVVEVVPEQTPVAEAAEEAFDEAPAEPEEEKSSDDEN